MSRFGPAVDRSQPRAVAKSPSLPYQKEPGHRYGRGVVLPGASMKGRHVVEIKIQGTSRNSATSPHTLPEGRDDDSYFSEALRGRSVSQSRSRSRSRSPSIASSVDLTAATVSSTVSSSSMHLSSVKAFEKPARADRAYRLKGPLPETTNKVSLQKEGISVNAEVISVSGQSSRGAGISPQRTSRYNSDGDEERSRSPSVRSQRSQRSALSSSSSSSHLSYRSNYSKYTNFQTLSSLSDLVSSSLYQSISQGSATSNLHHLQLSQRAAQRLRQSRSRAEIARFLLEEDSRSEHLLQQTSVDDIFQHEDLALRGQATACYMPFTSSVASPAPPAGGVASSSSGVYHTYPGILEAPASPEQQQKVRHRKVIFIQKVLESLRGSLREELLFCSQSATPDQIFFPSLHMHSEDLARCRYELADIIAMWRKTFLREAVARMDDLCARGLALRKERRLLEARRQRRVDLLSQIHGLLAESKQRGVVLDRLLARFPPEWFPTPATPSTTAVAPTTGKLSLQSGHMQDGEEEDITLEQLLERSVFLSPERRSQDWDSASPAPVATSTSFPTRISPFSPLPVHRPSWQQQQEQTQGQEQQQQPPQLEALLPQLQQEEGGSPSSIPTTFTASSSTRHGKKIAWNDPLAVNLEALRLLADPPVLSTSETVAEEGRKEEGEEEKDKKKKIVYYNISPEEVAALLPRQVQRNTTEANKTMTSPPPPAPVAACAPSAKDVPPPPAISITSPSVSTRYGFYLSTGSASTVTTAKYATR